MLFGLWLFPKVSAEEGAGHKNMLKNINNLLRGRNYQSGYNSGMFSSENKK